MNDTGMGARTPARDALGRGEMDAAAGEGPLVLRTRAQVQAWRANVDVPLAFVPTMGFLHAGHLSLVELARREVGATGLVIASIFVNPTQFAPGEDLASYPRDEAGDLAKLASVGVAAAFCPLDPSELHPRWPERGVHVDVPGLDAVLCGRSRPTHFRGVATVVCKLWNIVRPDVAVFGRKDFQQLAVLHRMHHELFLGGRIVEGDTLREPDGLAMSSRNAYLDARARGEAAAIPRFLAAVMARFAVGERAPSRLTAGAEAALAPGVIDYVEVRDAETLAEVARVDARAVCALAVRFGGARLIDNVVLDPADPHADVPGLPPAR